jgi:hypothetical protein
MPFAVRVVPRPEYEAWLAAQPRGAVPSVPVGSPFATGPAGSADPSDEAQPVESGP